MKIRTIAWTVFVMPVMSAGVSLVAQAAKFDAADAKAVEALRAIWSETAEKAAQGGHERLMLRALDEARSIGATGKALDEIEEKIVTPGPILAPKDGPEAAALLQDAIARSAAAVEPVLALDPGDRGAERFDAHLLRMLASAPKAPKWAQLLQKRIAAAFAKKSGTALSNLVMRAAELDPAGYGAGKYAEWERALMELRDFVVRGRDHLMQARVVLPEGYTRKKTWPLFVAIAGANCAYDSLLVDLERAGAKSGCVLVVAMTIGNANELPFAKLPYPRAVMERYADMMRRPKRILWDEQGLLSVLDEVKRRFGCEEKFFLTGYSGGGFPTYYWLLHHADQLAGACLGSANYWEAIEEHAVSAPDGGCPVLIVTGGRDGAGKERIFPQSDQGAERLKTFGFTKVERRHLESRDHEPFLEEGLELYRKSRPPAPKGK